MLTLLLTRLPVFLFPAIVSIQTQAGVIDKLMLAAVGGSYDLEKVQIFLHGKEFDQLARRDAASCSEDLDSFDTIITEVRDWQKVAALPHGALTGRQFTFVKKTPY
jgi:hypothetical protein